MSDNAPADDETTPEWAELIHTGPREGQSVEEWAHEIATGFGEEFPHSDEKTVPAIEELILDSYVGPDTPEYEEDN